MININYLKLLYLLVNNLSAANPLKPRGEKFFWFLYIIIFNHSAIASFDRRSRLFPSKERGSAEIRRLRAGRGEFDASRFTNSSRSTQSFFRLIERRGGQILDDDDRSASIVLQRPQLRSQHQYLWINYQDSSRIRAKIS